MDSATFFRQSSNVWMAENFITFILNEGAAQPDPIKVTPTYFDLGEPVSNPMPEDEQEHLIFRSPALLLDVLATLLQAQPVGEKGRLLNDSSANTFYVRCSDGNIYMVLVRFELAQGKWRCGAYFQGKTLQLPKVRIFSPNPYL